MTKQRWLLGLLAASLALNVAAVGFVIGRGAGGSFRPPFAQPLMGAGALLRELPAERREAIEATLGDELRHGRPPIREMRRAQRALREAMTAESFSKQSLTQALEGFRSNLCSAMARSNASFVDVAALLTAAERAALVERMGRRGGHRRPPPGPPPGPRPDPS